MKKRVFAFPLVVSHVFIYVCTQAREGVCVYDIYNLIKRSLDYQKFFVRDHHYSKDYHCNLISWNVLQLCQSENKCIMLFSPFLSANERPTFMEVSSRYSLIPPPPFSSFPLKRSTVSPLESRLLWGPRDNEICISSGCVLLAIRNAIVESNLPGVTVARISDLTVIVR